MGDFKFQVGDPVFASDRPECAVVMLKHRTNQQNVYLIGWQGGKIMTIQDEADLRPVEPELTPEDEFKTGDRVRHNKHGWVGTLGGVRFRDGTFFVKWDESITTFSDHIHPRDLTRIDEKAEEPPKAVPTFKFGGRVRHNLSGRTGVVVVEADPSSFVRWDDMTTPYRVPDRDLSPVEARPVPVFTAGDRVQHDKMGWTGTVKGFRVTDGAIMVGWNEYLTMFYDPICPDDISPVEEKVEVEPIPKVEMYGRVRDVSSGREGFTLGTLKRDGEWGYLVMWDGQDWSPQWVPERQLVAIEKKKDEEPTMPADPNAGRPTCSTCPMMAVVPPTREVSVEASQKYPDANVYQCHALPPARSLVMPWSPTTPDQFCGAHPDFQTWLDARDMARQGERPAREG